MESRRMSFGCTKCSYSTKRSYNLKRHLTQEHTSDRSCQLEYGLPKRPQIQEPEDGLYTKERCEENMDTSYGPSQLGDGLPRHQPKAELEDGLYTEKVYEENMSAIRARFPTMNFDVIDPRFMHPFTAIIAGPSQSGKSMFCMRLIRNARECIAPPPERIVYCYSVYQTIFDQFPNVEFVEGLPDLNMFDGVKRTLLIIDDLMQETNDVVSKLFTRVSHPKNQAFIQDFGPGGVG